ncbi:FkbM family methyltransferase [Roseobacteraceae bacterium S113]
MEIDGFPPPKKRDASTLKWLKLYYWGLARSGGRRSKFVRKANLCQPNATYAAFCHAVEEHRGAVFFDLGANLGTFTNVMAPFASRVIAVEPDPWTAERLRENTAHLENVEVIEAAVGTEDGEITIFRTTDFDDDPELASIGTTTLSGKTDTKGGESMRVRQISFASLLEMAGGRAGVVKMDIEGAEVDLLEHLLVTPSQFESCGAMFVETHEAQVPGLEWRTRKLRARMWWRQAIAKRRNPFVSLNWW